MKKQFSLFSIMLVVFLSGCATSGTEMQAACEQKYSTFDRMYQCTYDAIRIGRPQVFTNGPASLYMLKGQKLAELVKSGELSSIDASIQWKTDYIAAINAIRSDNERDNAQISRGIITGALAGFAASANYNMARANAIQRMPMPPMEPPHRQINCYTIGNQMTCQ